jgi:hypothetical protein
MVPDGTPSEPSAVLVLRVLIDGSPGGLQARLTRSLDISTGERQVTTATTVDQVCDGVRTWLEAFVLGHSSDSRTVGDGQVTAPDTPS